MLRNSGTISTCGHLAVVQDVALLVNEDENEILKEPIKICPHLLLSMFSLSRLNYVFYMSARFELILRSLKPLILLRNGIRSCEFSIHLGGSRRGLRRVRYRED
jgi:hypothetical protein